MQSVVSFTPVFMDPFNSINLTFYGIVIVAFFSLLFIIRRAYDNKSKGTGIAIYSGFVLIIWLSLQAFLANNNFYLSDTSSFPPRLLLAILPPFIIIIYLLISKGDFIEILPGKWMTFFHVIRVPVELVLYGLFMEKMIPEVMTFAGRNYDILIGLSAPVMAMLFYSNTSIHKRWIIAWNILGLVFLVNVVSHGILSTPYPFQQFGLDQPNIAVLQYPVIWLPSFIVPVVLFFHLVCIKQLLRKDHPGY